MSSLNSNLFTRTLTTSDSPFVIDSTSGLNLGSLRVNVDGAGTIQGTRAVNGLLSQAIALNEGDVISFSTDNGLNQVTIVISTGTIDIFGA